jgi:hypothetical protein
LADYLRPSWLGSHDGPKRVQDQHAPIKEGKSISCLLKANPLDGRIAVTHHCATCLGGEEVAVFSQFCCQLAGRKTGQFLVPFKDQVLSDLLVRGISHQSHGNQNDGRGHEGPGNDLGAKTAPPDTQAHSRSPKGSCAGPLRSRDKHPARSRLERRRGQRSGPRRCRRSAWPQPCRQRSHLSLSSR